MKFETINAKMEKYILPLANKMSSQRHLKAIRDAFISLMPITLVGGIAAIVNSAPVTETTTNGILLAWASFAQDNALILNWINTLTLGAMSLYICIGITNFLCKQYKTDVLLPIMLSVTGFMMLCIAPQSLGWDGKIVEISYLDGKGLIPAIFIAIFTVEFYHLLRKKNVGRIKMPDSVPASLSETFASLVPGIIILGIFVCIFAVFNALGTTMPGFIYTTLAPAFTAADTLPFAIIATLLVHVFWFFGIHDAALSGILSPIRDGGLSLNAAAHVAGQSLPNIFTTPFWVYFVVIGGCGSCLALAILLIRSKSKQLRTVGKIGIVPTFFGISEPIIFGVPLMLNPIFFIPFIFGSVVNATIAYILMDIGIIGKTFAMLSWQMPSIFGAFLSTMDIKALILIVVLIIIDILIYYPFFKIYEKQLVQQEISSEE
ncbi:PTS sugar transporter subunit IIC [Amedibacterium intestinale]|uniref:PTS sugar transporter subunit IIC n=1 Tax=Amedibacterium intestinale TaxID=2583452 RepID=UPI000E209A65